MAEPSSWTRIRSHLASSGVEKIVPPTYPRLCRLWLEATPAIASVHVQYWRVAKEEAIHHLQLLENALKGRRLLIIGGDFNAGTTPPTEHLPELEANTFFGGLKRAKLPPGTMTGLTGDFSAQVVLDHIYTSQDLDIVSAQALAVPLKGGPYSMEGSGPADVIFASDH